MANDLHLFMEWRYFRFIVSLPAWSSLVRGGKNAPTDGCTEGRTVAGSMRYLGSLDAVPAILASLADPNADVRNELVQALPTYNYNPIPLIAALRQLRNDPDKGVRAAVRDAIERISQRLPHPP
jgi:hypothetical protein